MIDTQKELGEFLKFRGMETSLNNADRCIYKWKEKAIMYLKEFLERNPNKTFLAEDIRTFAENNGLEDPPSKRAWGGIIHKAHTIGLIRPIGFKAVENPKAHRTPATLWVNNNVL